MVCAKAEKCGCEKIVILLMRSVGADSEQVIPDPTTRKCVNEELEIHPIRHESTSPAQTL